MFDVTVSEAAGLLGVSKTRVHQLIVQGVIDAEKVGTVWMLDRTDVERRIATGAKPGRPGRHALNSTGTYVLMNRTHEVLAFKFDSATGEFFDADRVFDAARAPVAVMSARGKTASKSALSWWWEHRAIPETRSGMDARLAELGLDKAFNLPFRNFGLSLSDQYWIRPEGLDVSWEDVNYFDNAFGQARVGAWLDQVGFNSPDNTSEGMFPKIWTCDGAERLLLKGGGLLDQEPYNEVAASALHRRLLSASDYVPYHVRETNDRVVSCCPDFLTSEEEYIPACYVMDLMPRPFQRDDYRHYVECAALLGADVAQALRAMIVCDHIIANTDRHWRNFGLVRNVETLECRPAPLFDSGTSLWCDVPTRDMEFCGHAFTSKPFDTNPKRQLWLADDFSWIDPAALDGFAEEAADILDENPGMYGRVDFIYDGVRRHVDQVKRLLL